MRRRNVLLTVPALLSAMLLAMPAMAEEGFTGTAHGNNGRISAAVTMEGERITSIEIDAPWETPGLGLPAVEEVAEAIVEQQSLDVDVVSGATISSKAAVKAVENALETAGIDT